MENPVPGEQTLLTEILWISKRENRLDLTQGNISRAIWIVAIPQILTNLMQTLFNLVDIFWVGKLALGTRAIAAVSIAGTLMMLLFMVIMGVGTGALALVARSYGQKDYKRANRITANAILLSLFLSIPVSYFGARYSGNLFLFMGADAQVSEAGQQYLSLMFMASSVIFLTFVLNAVLQGVGDALTPMKIMVSVLILNLILDPFLIFGWGPFPNLGIRGAAWATIISRLIASLVLLFKLYYGELRLRLHLDDFIPDRQILMKIIRLGGPNSIQLSLRGIMGIVIIGLVASFGTSAVAAYGIGHRLFMLALFPGFGFAIAAAGLVGQNLGSGQPERSARSAYITTYYYLVFLAGLMVAGLVFPEKLISLFDTTPEVVDMGASMLRITALGLPLLAPSLILNRSLGGAGDTISPMIITMISLWGLQVPLAILLSRIPALGVSGIFWAGTIAISASGLMALFWFRRRGWQTIDL